MQDHQFRTAYGEAKQAHDKAETAFFDPDMLALLYFPEEHKWAVYLPLFLPLWFPLFGNLSSEYKRYKKRKAMPTQTSDSQQEHIQLPHYTVSSVSQYL